LTAQNDIISGRLDIDNLPGCGVLYAVMLRDLPRNARITLLIEPGSSVLACILTFYGALYMQGNGLDTRQIGLIATLSALAGLACQFAAAPITNRLGRRRTLLVFSLVCWSIPLLLWAAADGFLIFLAAAVVFSFARITSVAWYCVATEDVRDDQKPRVFGALSVIASLGGIATVFAGPVLDRFGLVPALRVLYVAGFVIMTAMFAVRHWLLTETSAGAELNGLHAGTTWAQDFRRHLAVVAAAARNAEFRRLAAGYVLVNFAAGMGFVQVLFLNNVLQLTMTEISLLPPVAAVAAIVLYRFALPRLRADNERPALGISLLVLAAGTFMLALLPAGRLGLVLVASALAAGGSYMYGVCVNAAMNNRMGLLHKADLFSAVQLLSAGVAIPAGCVAGYAFALSPRLALVLIGLAVLAAATVTVPALGPGRPHDAYEPGLAPELGPEGRMGPVGPAS
jgi:MFS family permease